MKTNSINFIRSVASLRLDGGYLALLGDQTSAFENWINNGFFQLWDGSDWVTSTDLSAFSFDFFSEEEDAFAFSGYSNLGGYTIVSSFMTASVVPEPNTSALFVAGGTLACVLSRRRALGA